ncbi:hypothetical protein SK224_12225 [Microbacterium sp. BG28]|uniref:hypothetical protein n=1 Tax=Microbacterium sp. BG28 TaxID=3097356 RepID=UPI002A5AC1B1|nr:hypothetical protein [Microbacterium sp. BG28]MDY0829890.1 hypothetical protein [Microbacterium sp. BG28]
MSSISQIALDLAQLAQNIARLQEQASAIPDRAQVTQVQGAQQEQAQQTYLNSLSRLAERVGRKTELVRLYVETNAEALQKAADALQSTDGDTSLAARRASAFIDASVANPPAPVTSTGGSPTSAPAPTSGPTPTAW